MNRGYIITIENKEEKQQLDTHIECEELLDTSILEMEEPTDDELSDIEIDNLIEDVYTLVDDLYEEMW